MCIDPANKPEETHFIRFIDKSFNYTELISGATYDAAFKVEEEL